MKAVFQNTAGMTLTEVMIALGVITVGLLALVATMPLGTSTIAESNLNTTATFLAQHRLEQIKNAQWAAVDTLGGGGSNGGAAVAQWPDEAYNTIVVALGNTNASYPRFRREVRIADCSVVSCSGIAIGTASANTLRQVTVTVFFLGLTGAGTASANEERVQIVTLIARRS